METADNLAFHGTVRRIRRSVHMATRKAAAKKTATKKYSDAASKSVEREMKAMKSSSGQKVTNQKQAIAIGLSEARRAGKKVPPPPGE
jgi:hypothetical protein